VDKTSRRFSSTLVKAKDHRTGKGKRPEVKDPSLGAFDLAAGVGIAVVFKSNQKFKVNSKENVILQHSEPRPHPTSLSPVEASASSISAKRSVSVVI